MLRILFSIVLIGVFCCTNSETHSQVQKPAKILAETPTGKFKVGDIVEVIFKAEIRRGWYIYSLGFDAECGPNLTEIKLDPNSGFELVGSLTAVDDKAKHDKIFDCDVRISE